MNYIDFVNEVNSQFADLRSNCKTFLEVETTRMKISDRRSSRGQRQWKIHLLEEGRPDQEDNIRPCDIAWFKAMRLIFSGHCSEVELERRLRNMGCENPNPVVVKLREKFEEDKSLMGQRAEIEDKINELNQNEALVFESEKMNKLFSYIDQEFPASKASPIRGIKTGLMRVKDLEKQIESINGGVQLEQKSRNLLRQSHDEDEKIEVIGGYLGCYLPSTERVFLVLPAIYNQAKRSPFIDPIELFEKVLIHEMAHCIHHIGIDSNDRIWGDFGYENYGKEVIEGLANFHTYKYLKARRKWMSIAGMYWLSQRQPPQYRVWRNWCHYRLENMNRMLVELRNPKNKYAKRKPNTFGTFDDELNKTDQYSIA